MTLNELPWKPGCCVDRKYGTGCTDDTCMRLPAGKTCGDCVHTRRCEGLGYTQSPDEKACSFFPRRFQETVAQP